jgi:hypothetical protein
MRQFKVGEVKQSWFRKVIGQSNRHRRNMQLQFFGIIIALMLVSPVREFYLLFKDLDFRIETVQAQEQKLSVKDYAWEQAKKNGLDPVNFVVIIFHESRWNTEAIGVNKNKTYDAGLLQINSIHKDISLSDKLDPYKAIDWAIKKRLHDGNYSAWVAANQLGIRK